MPAPIPTLGTVFILAVDTDAAAKFHSCLDHALQGIDYDIFGEKALTIREPLARDEYMNGGVWLELFDTRQVAHTHQDDETGMARERFLLVIPRGADGCVDILPADYDGSQQSERFIFNKNTISLLHFDGTCPHRFATLGTEANDSVFAVAFHVRDVDTSLDALTEQTEPLRFELPTVAPDHIYGLLDLIPNAQKEHELSDCFDRACHALNHGNQRQAAFLFHDIIRMVGHDGAVIGSFNPHLRSVSVLDQWREYMEKHDRFVAAPAFPSQRSSSPSHTEELIFGSLYSYVEAAYI